MSLNLRDGKFDVAVLAGPRVEVWPSAGARALAALCAEAGLTVGLFGGETIQVKGVVPLPGTGGIVIAQDVQRRIHRIHARAVVRVSVPSLLPDPFPGWRSEGLLPLSTAERLRKESEIGWDPLTVILGTGNRALRFGSSLLEAGAREVMCVESFAKWEAKRYAGWEVERRRFEMAGGRIIEAEPVSLSPKAAQLYELRLQDEHGVRVLEATRVVSAGPFRDSPEFREYPPGSLLFEFEQTAAQEKFEDVHGWVMEEERGRAVAGKIVRALASELGGKKEELERIFKRARGRLRRYHRHREAPFQPAFQGKWVAAADSRRMRQFTGVPQSEHKKRPVASIECFEEIPCNLCQLACPKSAIEIGKVPRLEARILDESRCDSCGLCLPACPSEAVLLVHEKDDRPMSVLTLPWRGSKPWTAGEFATLINRRGESLGSARVIALREGSVDVEVPAHLVWEGRGLRRLRAPATEDEAYLEADARLNRPMSKVEITMNGEKRLVRDHVPVTLALFETGRNRPEDALFCKDGSCGLCDVLVDGVRKKGCQTLTHRGMAIRLDAQLPKSAAPRTDMRDRSLCPCLAVSTENVVERMSQGNLQSPEAVLSVTHVGEGRCHGQLCMEPFKRVLLDQGLDAEHWVDWRFPWSDWVLTNN